MLGYLILLLIFLLFFSLSFFFGFQEWFRPRDASPLPVDPSQRQRPNWKSHNDLATCRRTKPEKSSRWRLPLLVLSTA